MMKTSNASHEKAPLAWTVHAISFAVWVSICSVAPEFIWQGFLANLHELSWAEGGAVILTGGIIAFFVEPLTERLRSMTFHVSHEHKSTTHATLVAFGVAILAVFVHEAIATFIEHPPRGYPGKDSMAYAISEVVQWAWIPFAITIAWLTASKAIWISVTTFFVALVSVAIIGLIFRWDLVDSVTTGLPCACILVFGYIVMRKQRGNRALRHCAVMTARIALIWLATAGLLELALSRFSSREFIFYPWSEYTIDFRFYVGWVIGLAVAPQPSQH
jgi:hypothetical protein